MTYNCNILNYWYVHNFVCIAGEYHIITMFKTAGPFTWMHVMQLAGRIDRGGECSILQSGRMIQYWAGRTRNRGDFSSSMAARRINHIRHVAGNTSPGFRISRRRMHAIAGTCREADLTPVETLIARSPQSRPTIVSFHKSQCALRCRDPMSKIQNTSSQRSLATWLIVAANEQNDDWPASVSLVSVQPVIGWLKDEVARHWSHIVHRPRPMAICYCHA